MSTVSTHILDATAGVPATGVTVTLASGGTPLASGVTDDDGRIGSFGDVPLEPGTYTLTFATGGYFEARGTESFYPEVVVTFRVPHDDRHLHVPLLLSPFSYSTYRGS
ncbi:hydroxyisourate hydrolase [Rhodococcus phenolicus]|uniref:hydroxyisourate hydrolase n=1 Tax=Rhodococcus phenolicus TaxID=263849 RepID=UPI00083248B8|nr:hydroxyisourate hydrolase [Rhodococcus phenolicus]